MRKLWIIIFGELLCRYIECLTTPVWQSVWFPAYLFISHYFSVCNVSTERSKLSLTSQFITSVFLRCHPIIYINASTFNITAQPSAKNDSRRRQKKLIYTNKNNFEPLIEFLRTQYMMIMINVASVIYNSQSFLNHSEMLSLYNIYRMIHQACSLPFII